MLSLSLVEQIDRLLKAGQLSHRKIALRLGVSRGTVDAIANGRRRLFGKEPEQESLRDETLPPVRCANCGFLVVMPCLVCRTRDFRQKRRPLRTTAAALRESSHRCVRTGPTRVA